jgi:hypothetical protein
VGWKFQKRSESLSKFGVFDAGGFDSDFILEVIKHSPAVRKGC